VVRLYFRVSIPDPRTRMAYVLPFRPGSCPGPRVFGSRTTWVLSTDPAPVLSCTWAPPQRLAPSRVVSAESEVMPASRTKLLASLRDPSAWPSETAPLCAWLWAKRPADEAMSTEGPAFRVWLPSWRRKPYRSREPVSAPHAPGLFSPGPFPDSGAGDKVSRTPSARTLSCQPSRPGTGASAVFAPRGQRFPHALPLSFT
jgi:hypothetical protein